MARSRRLSPGSSCDLGRMTILRDSPNGGLGKARMLAYHSFNDVLRSWWYQENAGGFFWSAGAPHRARKGLGQRQRVFDTCRQGN